MRPGLARLGGHGDDRGDDPRDGYKTFHGGVPTFFPRALDVSTTAAILPPRLTRRPRKLNDDAIIATGSGVALLGFRGIVEGGPL